MNDSHHNGSHPLPAVSSSKSQYSENPWTSSSQSPCPALQSPCTVPHYPAQPCWCTAHTPHLAGPPPHWCRAGTPAPSHTQHSTLAPHSPLWSSWGCSSPHTPSPLHAGSTCLAREWPWTCSCHWSPHRRCHSRTWSGYDKSSIGLSHGSKISFLTWCHFHIKMNIDSILTSLCRSRNKGHQLSLLQQLLLFLFQH